MARVPLLPWLGGPQGWDRAVHAPCFDDPLAERLRPTLALARAGDRAPLRPERFLQLLFFRDHLQGSGRSRFKVGTAYQPRPPFQELRASSAADPSASRRSPAVTPGLRFTTSCGRRHQKTPRTGRTLTP